MTHLIVFALGLALGMVICALIARNNAKKAAELIEFMKKKDN
jgi:uncharacterized membrane protein YciS (DUF1049 family)